MRRLAPNPVLQRELTERWRGRRAFVVLTAYVTLLALVTRGLYWLGQLVIRSDMGFMGIASGPALGRFLSENLLGIVLFLVLFITPGYAAAQISGERERRSLPLLQVTLLRPVQIVLGKLGASLAWLVLLVLAAMPFVAAAFFLGGVAIGDLVRATAYIVGLAVAIAGMALGISSLTRRTSASVVLTYGLVLALVFGSLFLVAAEMAVKATTGRFDERPVSLYANPFYGLADAARVRRSDFGGQLPSVLTIFGVALPGEMAFEEPVPLAPPPDLPPPPPRAVPVPPDGVRGRAVGQAPAPRGAPVWLVVLGVYGTMGATGLTIATLRVRPGSTVARAGRQAARPPGRQPRAQAGAS
ncbi:MAG: ABC transporter permease [Actinobacteria bacterium]|nr:ABC transporter permease [Actinomycetota bacterium]